MSKAFVEIDLGRGSTREARLAIYADGTVKHHSENDGVRFLREVPEAVDERMTAAVAKQRWPVHAEAIDQALSTLKTSS